jgi:hypothetical protein
MDTLRALRRRLFTYLGIVDIYTKEFPYGLLRPLFLLGKVGLHVPPSSMHWT